MDTHPAPEPLPNRHTTGVGARLHTRDEFREIVLARHGGRCCVPDCTRPAVDAHHILERRLWLAEHERGGYFLTNGAAVCEPHHLDAERTILACDDLRRWSGIDHALVPEHFYLDADLTYSKWGDIIQPDGRRLPGPLFWDESVQKVLGHDRAILDSYQLRVKYPRTLHVPWSPGRSDDDKIHTGVGQWAGIEVVVTEKFDGENMTVYPDGYTHARSVDSGSHPSRSWATSYASRWQYELAPGMRVVGENLYAVHSITYTELPTLFLVHSIWDGATCLSWDATVEWCELLDVAPVRVLWRGVLPTDPGDAERVLDVAWRSNRLETVSEGYVIRPAAGYALAEFSRVVGKYVRAEHVSSDRHWRHRPVRPNGLATAS